jgi:Tol biopolymer transport system component
LTRLTFGSGLQTDVTWSPDGRFIAYASDRTGNFDIWVQSVGGGDPVQVTRSVAHDLQPDWSSDGSTLVFRSERDGGGLFLVPALGGVERQLTSFGSYPFWSPNSSEILFMEETRLGSSEAPLRLFVVSPEEGTPREILADFFSGGSWSWIASHPDGRISAMGKHRQLGRGFFTVARDGMQLVQSEESPGFPLRVYVGGGFVRRRFRWHPSGTALYVQTESNGVYNLWRVRVDPKTLLWVSAERLTTGAGPDVAPALSRDGTRLAFSTEQGTSRLWVFPLDPVARRLGSGRPLTEDGASAVTAALSPDGRFVAYTLLRPGMARAELWITDLVEGTSQLVATDGEDPCWSPDGKAIAYNYLRPDKQPITGRTAVRQLGGKERFLSRWSTDLFMDCDWSSDRGLIGTYMVSQSDVTSLVLWPMANPDADKPDRVLISKPETGLWQAGVSPNGRWLSFLAFRGDRPTTVELHVASADGLGPEHWRRIAADHVWPDKPRWAPDGRTLYFISRRPTSYFNLWAVRFDPERGTAVDQPFALTHFDSQSLVISPEMTQSDMDVSSRHVVLTMKTVAGSIWMLDNVDK